MAAVLQMSSLPAPCRADPTPSRAGCSGPDWADVIAQLPGRHFDVVILDARLHLRVVHIEGDGDLVRGVADDVEDQLGCGGGTQSAHDLLAEPGWPLDR